MYTAWHCMGHERQGCCVTTGGATIWCTSSICCVHQSNRCIVIDYGSSHARDSISSSILSVAHNESCWWRKSNLTHRFIPGLSCSCAEVALKRQWMDKQPRMSILTMTSTENVPEPACSAFPVVLRLGAFISPSWGKNGNREACKIFVQSFLFSSIHK